MTDTGFVEQQRLHAEAERLRAEAAADRKAAEEALAKAEYVFGQADWRNRDTEAKLAIVARRELWLKTDGQEDVLRAREATAAAHLAQAQELMARYDKDRHAAAIALVQIDARERAERGEAA
jgi:hypothetical protein